MLDNADGHDLLAVVAAVHHERAGHALHNRALRLLEALRLEAARRVGHELRKLGLDSDVVLERDVADGDVIVAPLVEELDLARVRMRRHPARVSAGTFFSGSLKIKGYLNVFRYVF